MQQHFDLVVVGGGSGGLAAAKESVRCWPEKKVLLLDAVSPSPQGTTWKLGGTCPNAGCVPKKLMHHAATIGATLHKEAAQYGWSLNDKIEHSWERMQPLIADYVRSLSFNAEVALREAGIKYVEASATFDGPSSVVYTRSDKQTRVTFDKAIIATGGRPQTLAPLPGWQLALSSDDLFWRKRSPGKTLIVGAGYIALETASFLQHLGCDVTVMVRSTVLRKMDTQCGEMVAELMERDGIRFLRHVQPLALSVVEQHMGDVLAGEPHPQAPDEWFPIDADKKRNPRWRHTSTGVVETRHLKPAGLVTYAPANPTSPIQVRYMDDSSCEHVEEFQTVLVATGRKSNVHTLGLDKADVAVAHDRIIVDYSEETSNSRISAIGDVAISEFMQERPELTPVAIMAGKILARRLWDDYGPLMQYDCVPTTVFTSPSEYSFVGMGEEEARLKLGDAHVEVFWSRFGTIEVSPLHPDLPTQRSSCFTHTQLWARRYAKQRGLDWSDHDDQDNTETDNAEVLYKASCLAKVVCDKSCDMKIVGMHFVGPHAGEVIQGFAVALAQPGGLTKSRLDACIGIHPTAAEEFLVLDTSQSSGKSLLKPAGCGGGSC